LSADPRGSNSSAAPALASDLVGEKTDRGICRRGAEWARRPGPALVPRPEPEPHYELLIDTRDVTRPAGGARERVDRELRANPQYAYARRAIGQLGSIGGACGTRPCRPDCGGSAVARAGGSEISSPVVMVCDQHLVDAFVETKWTSGPMMRQTAVRAEQSHLP